MNQPDSNSDKEKKPILSKPEQWFIGISICLIIASPWIFTQQSFLGFDFSHTGEIGDTIGGITAPFVNLLAAYVVYKSFSAQIIANREQRENHDSQMKMIRQEQSFNSVVRFFEVLNEDIFESEKRLEQDSSIGCLSLNITKLQTNTKRGQRNFEENTKLYNSNVGTALKTVDRNINNLHRFMNLIIQHIKAYSSELYVYDLSDFYVTKINTLLEILKYDRITNYGQKHLKYFDEPNIELHSKILRELSSLKDSIHLFVMISMRSRGILEEARQSKSNN